MRNYLPITHAAICEVCHNEEADWQGKGVGLRTPYGDPYPLCVKCMRTELNEEHRARRVVYKAANVRGGEKGRELRKLLYKGRIEEVLVYIKKHFSKYINTPEITLAWTLKEPHKQPKAPKSDYSTAKVRKEPKWTYDSDGAIKSTRDPKEIEAENEAAIADLVTKFL